MLVSVQFQVGAFSAGGSFPLTGNLNMSAIMTAYHSTVNAPSLVHKFIADKMDTVLKTFLGQPLFPGNYGKLPRGKRANLELDRHDN